jgi:tyrosyl-tRNA synthetase
MSGGTDVDVEEARVGVESVKLDEAPVRGEMTLDERVALALSVGEECVEPEELKILLEKKPQPIAYDGFEPSGRMHIAQGILKSINVNKLTRAGCKFVFWVADYFAMLNEKMGGDLKKIRVVGEYMTEVWKAAGMDMEKVEFLWASDMINAQPDKYWTLVMDVARRNSLNRVKRCCTIMGRDDSDASPAAQILYPCMQCADIFDICQLGMDQRKVNMLAREYATATKRRFKPIVLSHHMLMGLKQGQAKMSKSDPDSAIFMEDSRADIKKKVKQAYCPPKQINDNPCVDYVRHLVFPKFGELIIRRKEEHGGDVTFKSIEAFEAAYANEELHPGDLKDALFEAIDKMIEPIREHFNSDPKAKQLLKQVRSFKVTR